MSTQNKPELDPLRLELEAIRRSLALTDLSPAELRELRERLGRLQYQLDNREAKGNGKVPAGDPLIFSPVPTRPGTQTPPKAFHRRRGRPRLARCVAAFHSALNYLLQALFWAFLVLFALQFPHPRKWDGWWFVVELKRFMEPLLISIDDALEWPQATFYYPLALALLMQAGRMVLDLNLRPWQQKLQRSPAKAHR